MNRIISQVSDRPISILRRHIKIDVDRVSCFVNNDYWNAHNCQDHKQASKVFDEGSENIEAVTKSVKWIIIFFIYVLDVLAFAAEISKFLLSFILSFLTLR